MAPHTVRATASGPYNTAMGRRRCSAGTSAGAGAITRSRAVAISLLRSQHKGGTNARGSARREDRDQVAEEQRRGDEVEQGHPGDGVRRRDAEWVGEDE